jgi:hypothetical protein
MNTNLKEILKHGEEEFNPQAWESLAKKLDAKMPVNKPNYFSGKNIFIAGASALFIGSGIFFFMNQKSNEVENISKEKQIAQTEKNIQTTSTEITAKTKENSTLDTKQTSQHNTQNFTEENQLKQNEESKLPVEAKEKKNESYWKEDDKKFSLPEISYTPFVLPKFENSYCLNEKINIYNSNRTNLLILDENFKVIATVHSKENKTLNLEKEGIYFAKYLLEDFPNSNYTEAKLFTVHKTEEINFSYDSEIVYENGIPYIQLSTSDFGNNSVWSTDKGFISEQNDKTKLSAFRKGEYNVSLTKIDENKCELKKSQQVEIKEEYNLLAPTAFDPSDLDPRNNRFIPYALQKRNTAFEMFILDPENGNIVFKSNSADNAWDGIDRTTNQLVKYGKAFIWKVSLKNPLPGEKSDYTGNIILVK